MRNRTAKWLLAAVLLFALVPAFSAQAATNATISNVTSTSLRLSWTFQPGETFVQIYKNGVYLDSRAGYNILDATGLTPCTPYTFTVVGAGYGSASASASTLGCPTAPVIAYTATAAAVQLSWTSSNATGYDIYKDGSLYATTSATSYTIGAAPSRSYEIRIVAKNGTGATASSTIVASTPGFTATFTQTGLSGNIRVGGVFTNTHPSYGTAMDIALYRITSSGDVYVGSTSVYVGANQTVGGWYPVATGQPFGDYKAVLTSPYAITSGLSIGAY